MLRKTLTIVLLASSAILPAFAQEQSAFVDIMPRDLEPGARVRLDVTYAASDETLTGLGLRVHWNSDDLDFDGLSNVFAPDLLTQGLPEPDVDDFDQDENTDFFVHVAWADRRGEWPGSGSTPLRIFTLELTATPSWSGSSTLGLSASSTAAGHTFQGPLIFRDGFESGSAACWSYMVDYAGTAPSTQTLGGKEGDPFGEGQRILRRLIELTPLPVGSGPELGSGLDVDGDGFVDAAGDGVLILRHLFGFRGELLVEGAVSGGATRTTPEIEAFLERLDAVLDVDGDGRRDALTDGLLILRFLSGFRGAALVDGVVSPGAALTSPEDIADRLEVFADPQGRGDSDGDGVSDVDEAVGYEILIDLLGLGTEDPRWRDTLTRRQVASDRFLSDSDGDGLDDLTERLLRTDPQAADTDLDGLTDAQEVLRFASTPTSVDSDGDARGPDRLLTPQPSFFDGRELTLFGTSPALADTDGDSRTDFTEANQNLTPPLVADVPQVAVELVGDVNLALDFTSTVTDETRTSQATLMGQTDTTGTSDTDSRTSRWAIGTSATVMAGVRSGFPGGVSASVSASFTVSGEYSQQTATSFTESSSTSTQEQFQSSQETAVQNSETITGGTIGVGLQIRNVGTLAFTLDNLLVTALVRDPADRQEFQAVATLVPQLPEGSVTLGPFNGETGVLQVVAQNVNVGLVESLMADPSGLHLDVATFDLEDAGGRDFAFLAEVTNARTALVTLDFGNGDVERYRVATLVERNPDGSGAGIRMEDVLTGVLDIPFATEPRTGSTDPEFPDGVRLLTRVRDVETRIDPDPDAFANSYWAVLSPDPSLTGAPGIPFTTDFADIVLRSRDTISLAYVSDADRDGLFAREEFLYGTTDEPRDLDGDGTIGPADRERTFDFDLDGLGDFFEVRTGWDVTVNGLARRQVFSDPTREDVDADGVDDAAEFRGRDGCGPHDPADPSRPDPACGGLADSGDATDPNNPDTDRDGQRDDLDDDPLDNFNPGPNLDLAFDLNTSQVLTVSGRVSDPLDGIASLTIDWGDGTPPAVLPSGSDFDNVSVVHQYLDTGTFVVVVTATDDRPFPGVPGTSQITRSFVVDFPGDPRALYFFDDGSVADLSGNGFNGDAPNVFTVPTPDRFGRANRAYCFDQTQVIDGSPCAEIRLPSIPLGAQLTLAAWTLRGNGNDGHILGQLGFARLYLTGGRVAFEIEDGINGRTEVIDPVAPPVQQVSDPDSCLAASAESDWTFYVATVADDGTATTVTLYRGSGGGGAATVVDSAVVPGATFSNPDPSGRLWIGGSGEECDTGSQGYAGRVDDVRVFDRALSMAEINALLNEVQNP